jgi:hypothetical protein
MSEKVVLLLGKGVLLLAPFVRGGTSQTPSKTDVGKIFTIFYVVSGVGIISAFIRSLVQRAQERQERRLHERHKQ